MLTNGSPSPPDGTPAAPELPPSEPPPLRRNSYQKSLNALPSIPKYALRTTDPEPRSLNCAKLVGLVGESWKKTAESNWNRARNESVKRPSPLFTVRRLLSNVQLVSLKFCSSADRRL